MGEPINILGALGDNIAPGLFREYRLPGKLNPTSMPTTARMISRKRLVSLIQAVETDHVKALKIREKMSELRAEDMSLRLQARTVMQNLKSNIVGVDQENEQVENTKH